MNIQDTITRAKIQKRVTELVKANMDDEGNVSFDVINVEIVKEFGNEATEIAKQQYEFMMF
jgi:putative component of toxin-antitoxin plasmid stabilization module